MIKVDDSLIDERVCQGDIISNVEFFTFSDRSVTVSSLLGSSNAVPTGTVTITGAATQGQPLTAANTLADADGMGTVTYTWYASGSGTSIGTGSTYTPTQAQVGKTLTVVASYTDLLGTLEAVSSLPTSNTLASDTTAPTVTSFTPTDGATAVGIASNIAVVFSEAIQAGVGLISLHTGSATGAVVESFIPASSDRLSISGNTLTINPSADLGYDTDYYVTFASDAITDLVGNHYAGTSTYDFTTLAATSSSSAISDISSVGLSPDHATLLIKFTNGEVVTVPNSSDSGSVTLNGTTYTTAEITQHTVPQSVFSSVGNNQSSYVLPDLFTGPASLNLKYQLIDASANAVIIGSTDNDFIKLGGTGNKAVNGGGGDNVIDGGTGSTFISGGGTSSNANTFFLDGRASGTSWSTITDFHLNHDYATIWGWLAGVSKVDTLFTDVNTGGAAGYTGLSLHFDNLLPDGSSSGASNANLNSITLSGHTLAEFGASSLVDLNNQITNHTNTHFITGQTHDSLGDHGYLWIN